MTAPALWSATLTVGIVLAGLVWRGTAPFGDRGRGINDLAAQYVPFHAHLWDMLHGQSEGGLLWNWHSALGVPFTPDLATYLGNPLALTVGLWPREQIETAVLVVTLATLAAAASAMTVYLLRIRPSGSVAIASLLGCAYATCGWALNDASYIPMWLTGLVGLPMLALVGEWASDRVLPIVGPLVVALVWCANYYTGFMATLGAGLLILVRVMGEHRSARSAMVTLFLVARHFILGIGMSMVLFMPALLAARSAQPTPDAVLQSIPWRDVLGRLLPITEGVGLTPSLYVGTATLIAALTVFFNSRVTRRLRTMILVIGTALVLSLNWAPTQSMWHGFDVPNGNPFREAFVVCGFIVVVAWIALTARPGWIAVCGGAAVTLAIVWWGHDGLGVLPESTGCALGVTALMAAWLLLREHSSHRRMTLAVAALLLAAVAAENTATWITTDARRETRLGGARVPWGDGDTEVHAWARDATADGERLGSIGRQIANAPLLYGYMGAGYYSSTMAATTSNALRMLGAPWSAGGRAISSRPDPGLDPLLGVTPAAGPDQELTDSPRPGMTARILPLDTPSGAADPWLTRNALAGTTIYEKPSVTVTVNGRTTNVGATGLRSTPGVGAPLILAATCPANTTVQFWAPSQAGSLRVRGEVFTLSQPGVRLGTRVSSGVHTVGVSDGTAFIMNFDDGIRLNLPAAPVGCLNPSRLEAALDSPSQRVVARGSRSMSVAWSTPQTGLTVLPTTAARGWSCQADGRPVSVRVAAGMLGLPLDGASAVNCSFRPPGLRLGGLISLLSLTMAIGMGLLSGQRRSRSTHP